MNYKVFITTSGVGSRLNELTQYTNKSLVRVGKKPSISYIIEAYPKNVEFVITLGYKGDQVKDFLKLAYPKHIFTFIKVDKYEGPGTSLGYSMLKAEKKLRCPFVFHTCDTLVEGLKVPGFNSNWVASIKTKVNSANYASFNVNKQGLVVGFNNKGVKTYSFIHIGLIGIKDYETFWLKLNQAYKENPGDTSLNDISGIQLMIEEGSPFKVVKVSQWLDVGNPDALKEARKHIYDRFDNLDKVDESLFFFKDFVIKFFSDPKKVKDRVKRGQILEPLVPKTLSVKKNFYKYKFVKGDRYSDVVTADNIIEFLSWSKKYLWKPVQSVSEKKFVNICKSFYYDKTLERIENFMISENIIDKKSIINGESIPTLKNLLKEIDFKSLSNGIQVKFHGDYILENILKTNNSYVLLDWRQDFGGLLKGGDIYYDLAKFYHNLIVNHDIISSDNFSVNIDNANITLHIKRKKNLKESERVFECWVKEEGFDLKKIKTLRALIWLNMSPLHHYPFNIFLFYFGKYYLWKALKNK